MRSIIEFKNYPHKDGTFTNIKMYLDRDKLVKYNVTSFVPFYGDMAILSTNIDQVLLNEFLGLAIKEINSSPETQTLSITKDFKLGGL